MSFWLRIQWILLCKLFNLHSLVHWPPYCTFPIGWPQKVLCVSSNFENDRLRGKSEPSDLFLLRLGKVRKSQTVLKICFKIFQFTCNLLPPFPFLCLVFSSPLVLINTMCWKCLKDCEQQNKVICMLKTEETTTWYQSAISSAGFEFRYWQRRSERNPGSPMFLCTGHSFDFSWSFQASNFTGVESQIFLVTSKLYLQILTSAL